MQTFLLSGHVMIQNLVHVFQAKRDNAIMQAHINRLHAVIVALGDQTLGGRGLLGVGHLFSLRRRGGGVRLLRLNRVCGSAVGERKDLCKTTNNETSTGSQE
jgi:hypothetical protein